MLVNKYLHRKTKRYCIDPSFLLHRHENISITNLKKKNFMVKTSATKPASIASKRSFFFPVWCSHMQYILQHAQVILLRAYLQLKKPRRLHSFLGQVVHESSQAISLLSWRTAVDGLSEDPCSSDRRIDEEKSQLRRPHKTQINKALIFLIAVITNEKRIEVNLKQYKAAQWDMRKFSLRWCSILFAYNRTQTNSCN